MGLAGGSGGLWGVADGALGDGDVDEGLDWVVLAGRLCAGGGRCGEGGSGCGRWGVLVWVTVRLGRCCLGCCRCFCGVGGCAGWCWWWCCCCWCGRLGSGLSLQSDFGLGSGSRLRRTSFRRCEGTCAGWGEFLVCCRGAWVVCVGVPGPPVAGRAAAALALAVAFWMRSAGRGGLEDEVEDVDDDEDEEAVVVLRDSGCAVMRAVAGLWAAASAAATAGRMEGMSSACRLGHPAAHTRPPARAPRGPATRASPTRPNNRTQPPQTHPPNTHHRPQHPRTRTHPLHGAPWPQNHAHPAKWPAHAPRTQPRRPRPTPPGPEMQPTQTVSPRGCQPTQPHAS